MADNTLLNVGSGGDTIRDLARGAGTIKTQVFQLDAGGVTGNAEVLITAGQQTMAASLPVVLASNQTSVPVAVAAGSALMGKVGIDQTTVGTTNKVAISDSLGNGLNSSGPGFLRITDEPTQTFYDSFDAALDTTNYWTSTQGSSGVAAAVGTGVLTMGTGTTASGYSKLISIPTFKPVIPGWVVYSDAIALPDGAAPLINSYRYWGCGTTPATPTVATPITDGYGFELSTDQKLRAVVYAGGTRTIIADLSSSGTNKQPLDASYHRYIIQVRTDKTFFYIDTVDSNGLVATTNFQSPQSQILSKLFLCVGNTPTAPVSNTQIQCTGAVVSDTGKNATQLADATFPWRKSTVKPASTGAASTDTALVVGLHPTSPLPTGTNIVGAVRTLGYSVTGSTTNISAGVPANTSSLAVSDAGNVTFVIKNTVAATAYTGAPVLVFEQSDDGTSWGPLVVTRSDTYSSLSTHTLAANSANVELMFFAALLGCSWIRCRCTTAPVANGLTIIISPGGMAFTPSANVVQQTITKGTQGTTGVTTQDLKDAGRNQTNYFMAVPIITTGTDALMSLTGYKSAAAVAATTTPAVVTTGKTFRLVSATLTYVAVATAGTATFTLRANSGGVVAITSPAVQVWTIGGPAAAAGVSQTIAIAVPDGFEFPAGTGIGISLIGRGATGTAAAVGYGQLSLHGFEY